MNKGYMAWMFVVFLLSGSAQVHGALIINEVLADPPASIFGDANGDGIRSATGDEFVELVSIASADLDIGGWSISDSDAVRFTFPVGTVLSPGASVVVFGGGMPTGIPGLVFMSRLSLNNAGDSIVVTDDAATEIAAFTYEARDPAVDPQSLTRSPDVTGGFVLHAAAAPGGALFSPGTRLEGTPFAVPLPPALAVFLPAVLALVPLRIRRSARNPLSLTLSPAGGEGKENGISGRELAKL